MICVSVCMGGGHNYIKQIFVVFMFQTILKSFKVFFPPLYFFKKLIILTDGGYPPPMENSMEIQGSQVGLYLQT